MTQEQIQAALKQIGEALHQQFEDEVGTHSGRLEQLDHALANSAAAAEALFDEEAREVDFAVRFMNDDAGKVSSPVAGRGKAHYAKVARRAQ